MSRQVVRIHEPSGWVERDASTFFDLPLSVRVRHVLERTVVFLVDGQEVEAGTFLAAVPTRRLRRVSQTNLPRMPLPPDVEQPSDESTRDGAVTGERPVQDARSSTRPTQPLRAVRGA